MSLDDLVRMVHGGESLRAEIDLHLKRVEAKPSNRSVGWHPSEFVDMCARASVLTTILGLEEEGDAIDGRLRRIFDTGTSLHAWYQNQYLGPMGVLWGAWRCSRCHAVQWGFMPKDRHDCSGAEATSACKRLCNYDAGVGTSMIDERGGCLHCGLWGAWEFQEVQVEHPFVVDGVTHVITGSSDGLLYLGRTWYVFEAKSINVRGFNMLAEPKSWHRKQASIYGHLMRKGCAKVPKGIEVPKPTHGIVFYIGKNDGEEKEFPYELSDAEGEYLISQPVAYQQALMAKELPEKHTECPSMFSARSKACAVATYCWGTKDYAELVQLRKK